MTPMTSRDRWRRVRSYVSSVLTAAVVSTVFAASVAAQDTTGVGAISGVVVNAAGQPAEGVRVCALDSASCATSDARGAFRIGELRAGAYRLEILPLEGLPFTSDPVDVRAGLNGTVDITLPKAEAAVRNSNRAARSLFFRLSYPTGRRWLRWTLP